MTLQQIISLSFVQGLTEFLPISSSGHLILIPKLLGWKDQGLLMDVAMHVGTLLGVLVYFHKDVWQMTTGFFTLFRGKINDGGRLFFMLCLATLPAVVFGFSLRFLGIEERGVLTVACTMTLFGAVMFLVDRFSPLRSTMAQMTFTKAFIFGLFQALALIPGTSRSGACLVAGRLMGFKRADAARFSFLMSIPSIVAAATLTSYEAWEKGETVINQEILLSIGFSALFGFMAIAFMMYWLQRSTLTIFVLYRFALGAVLFWFVYKGWLL